MSKSNRYYARNVVTTEKILSRQRSLSGMKKTFPQRRFKRSSPALFEVALESFKNPPRRGRPTNFEIQDRNQLKFLL